MELRDARPGPSTSRQRLDSIQMMRGVAALLVVVTHAVDLAEAHPHLGVSRIAGLGHLGNFGAIGVDLFFVISGFVMALSVANAAGAPAAGRFLVLRWARVAPPFLIACAVLICLHAFVGPPPALPWRAAANAVVFVPVLDRWGYTLPVLDVGWTLSFEFTFYLGVAAMVLLGLSRRLWLLAAGMTALVGLGAVLRPGTFLLAWVSNPIVLEFALGIVAYLVWERGLLTRVRPLWWTLGGAAAAVLAAQVVVGYHDVSEARTVLDGSTSALRVLLWGVPLFFLFLALLPLGQDGRDSRLGRAARSLGDSSYSLYLVHIPVFVVLGAVLTRSPALPVADLVVVVAVVLAVAAGTVFHHWVEAPINDYVRRVSTRHPAPARTAAPRETTTSATRAPATRAPEAVRGPEPAAHTERAVLSGRHGDRRPPVPRLVPPVPPSRPRGVAGTGGRQGARHPLHPHADHRRPAAPGRLASAADQRSAADAARDVQPTGVGGPR
ncbi:exopolysaccharide production protein ExoZ [Geodermatophilus bullaregiensis]|uniref:acyltransferase family protein n=1 Tax=Geodermatophilus bullaregiensis TaxID=1564160 RepID=UPI00195E6953|nr:acyltransferase [Geodermatophilus bullaregiensis]MBM7805837.1 exopolysaccharide production protein ExoZ [Geodermatophilus bullaregiensis]